MYARLDFWNNAASYFGRDGAEAIHRLFTRLGVERIKMIEGGELTFGAFRPEQVKSVFNRGSFGADTPQISEDQCHADGLDDRASGNLG